MSELLVFVVGMAIGLFLGGTIGGMAVMAYTKGGLDGGDIAGRRSGSLARHIDRSRNSMGGRGSEG